MPAGMELFPASDSTAWQIIQDVIDESDYYVLVLGGRYGSLDEAGISFTEREYEYAVGAKKAVLPFLHQNPDNLPRDRTETDGPRWNRLLAFRARIEKRHTCVYWNSADDLKAKVILGLTSAMKRQPAIGWIRADRVPSEATVSEILALRTKVAELERKLEQNRITPPEGIEELSQGSDTIEIHVQFEAYHNQTGTSQGYTASIEPTWEELFAAVAPSMINEASDRDLRNLFWAFFRNTTREVFQDEPDLKDKVLREIELENDDQVDTCIIQFRALGLIQESRKPRSVKDTQTYWTLTPYGDQTMTNLRALRRTSADEAGDEDSAASDVLPRDLSATKGSDGRGGHTTEAADPTRANGA